MTKKILLILVAVALALSVGLIGCTTPSQQEEEEEEPTEPQYGGTLTIIKSTGPTSPFGWPPKINSGSARLAVKDIVFENLVNCDSYGNIEPWLAESYEIAPDGKSCTFTLRQDVKFHDGSDFNAEVAKFNLDAIKAGGISGTDVWESIDVLGDYEIRINLTDLTNTFLYNLSMNTGFMCSQEAYELHGQEWCETNPVGTGPFKFVEWERDVSLTYERFDNYWREGKPYLDGYEIVYIADEMTREAAMEAGEAQMLGKWSSGKVASDLQAKGFQVEYLQVGTCVLMPDSVNPGSVLADKRVREAIYYAIDRESIVEALGYGFWEPAYQVCPASQNAYKPGIDIEGSYDPDRAMALLADTGYTSEDLTIKIILMPGFIDVYEMLVIADYLNAVGFNVELEYPDRAGFAAYRAQGWSDALVAAMIPVLPNYLAGLEMGIGPHAVQYPSIAKSATYSDAFDAALRALDPGSIEDLSQEMSQAIFNDMMVIPVHFTQEGYIFQPGVVHDTGRTAAENYIYFFYWRPGNIWLTE